MRTKEMRDSDGDFSEPQLETAWCSKCGSEQPSEVQAWDSHCGGYTDYRYRCRTCGQQRWSEGPDA